MDQCQFRCTGSKRKNLYLYLFFSDDVYTSSLSVKALPRTVTKATFPTFSTHAISVLAGPSSLLVNAPQRAKIKRTCKSFVASSSVSCSSQQQEKHNGEKLGTNLSDAFLQLQTCCCSAKISLQDTPLLCSLSGTANHMGN